jgi:hypothetical protein
VESRVALESQCMVSAALSRRGRAPASRNMEVILDSARVVSHLQSRLPYPANVMLVLGTAMVHNSAWCVLDGVLCNQTVVLAREAGP